MLPETVRCAFCGTLLDVSILAKKLHVSRAQVLSRPRHCCFEHDVLRRISEGFYEYMSSLGGEARSKAVALSNKTRRKYMNIVQKPAQLIVPVTKVKKPCEECGSTIHLNLEYNLVGIVGTLCAPCLETVVRDINSVLSSRIEIANGEEK